MLREKGLYGQLIQLDTMDDAQNVPDVRHLHPQEVAILNALIPSYVTPSGDFHLRLELSAVGQMASPIQSLWVLAQVHTHAHQVGLFPKVPTPEEHLMNLCKTPLQERGKLWNHRTEYMLRFEGALKALHDKVERTDTDALHVQVERTDPIALHGQVESTDPDALHDKVERTDSNALHDKVECTVPIALHDKVECTDPNAFHAKVECTVPIALHDKVECTGAQALHPKMECTVGEEVGLTQEILEFLESSGTHAVPACEDLAQIDPYMSHEHSNLSDLDAQDLAEVMLTVVDSDSSTDAAFEQVHPETPEANLYDATNFLSDNQDKSEDAGKSPHGDNRNSNPDLLTSDHSTSSEGTPTCEEVDKSSLSRKRKHVQTSDTVDQAQFAIGAVPGFSTSKVPAIAAEVPTPPGIEDDSPAIPDKGIDSDLEERTQMDPTGVIVVVAGQNIHTIRTSGDSTIGQLAVATDKLGQMSEPIKVTTVVGAQLPLSSTVKQGSFIRFQELAHAANWRCRGPHGHSPCPILVNDNRSTLLWQQEGWVATDDMKFYMTMVQSAHQDVQCHVIDILPELDYHVVFSDILLKAITCMQEDNLRALAIAVLYNHHWVPIFIQAHDKVHITMPPDESMIFRQHIHDALGEVDFQYDCDVLPHAFPADCGFQTIGWLISKIRGEDAREPWIDEQAGQWRAIFHQRLEKNQLASLCSSH